MKGELLNIFFIAPLLGLSISDIKVAEGEDKDFGPIHDWPKYDHFGQISAISVDSLGKVYVFHRGNRQWDASTFSMNNIFVDKSKGPIRNETIIVLDHKKGTLIKKTGANLFYLPHGLTVDDDFNIWVTDVALHQVFKFPPINFIQTGNKLGEANLTLGVPFEPGSDEKHFCKPTAVAVDKLTKEFYVSDGYCNARIIKFDQFGNLLLKVGRTSVGNSQADFYMLKVPHGLSLAQDKKIIYVADRENFRVVSYSFQSGKFDKSFAQELRSRVFSVAYSPLEGGLLFVLTNDNSVPKMVAVYNAVTGKLILSFSPKTNFTNPHDLAVSHDGSFCYVVELNPYKVWKFKLDMETISQFNHHKVNGFEKTSEKPMEILNEPVPAESKVDKIHNFEASSSFLAVGLVVSIVVISFLIFMFHYYKRKGGYRRYETRRLILDDDEGGIRLT